MYATDDERRAARVESQAKYRASEKGRAASQRANRRYRHSSQGKQTRVEYEESAKRQISRAAQVVIRSQKQKRDLLLLTELRNQRNLVKIRRLQPRIMAHHSAKGRGLFTAADGLCYPTLQGRPITDADEVERYLEGVGF